VRRDAAAALLALALNDDNLPLLAAAGTLGAVLALIGDGVRDARTDGECIRDATDAMAQLVKVPDVRRRFLCAPHGIEIVFKLVRGGHRSERRKALVVLQNLCTSDDANEAVVQHDGLRHLVHVLSHSKDDDLRLAAARVLAQMARSTTRRAMLFDDHCMALHITMLSHPKSSGEKVDAALIDFVAALAETPELRGALVKTHSLHKCLVMKLQRHAMPLSTCAKVLHSLLSLATDEGNRRDMVADPNLLPAVTKACFTDLPARFGLASLAALGVLAPDFEGESPHKSQKPAPCRDGSGLAALLMQRATWPFAVMRHGAALVEEISKSAACGGDVIDSGVLLQLIQAAQVTFDRDRGYNRTVAATISLVARSLTVVDRPRRRAQALAAQGGFVAIEHFLMRRDAVQKSHMAHALAALLDYADVDQILCKPNVCREILSLQFVDADVECVARLVARTSAMPDAVATLAAVGAAGVMLGMLPQSFKHGESHAGEVLRSLANLAADAVVRVEIAKSPSMRHIFNVGKLEDHPGRKFAKEILRQLGLEASAMLVQLLIQRFCRRMKDHNFRRRFREQSSRFIHAPSRDTPPPNDFDGDLFNELL